MTNASDFRQWLDTAAVGDEMVYHVGNLTVETDREVWVQSRAAPLNELVDAVLAAKRDGRVKLLQRPLAAKGAAKHIARCIS